MGWQDPEEANGSERISAVGKGGRRRNNCGNMTTSSSSVWKKARQGLSLDRKKLLLFRRKVSQKKKKQKYHGDEYQDEDEDEDAPQANNNKKKKKKNKMKRFGKRVLSKLKTVRSKNEEDSGVVGMNIVVRKSQTNIEVLLVDNKADDNNSDDEEDDDDDNGSLSDVSAISLPEELGTFDEDEISEMIKSCDSRAAAAVEGEETKPRTLPPLPPPPPPQQQQQHHRERRNLPPLLRSSRNQIVDYCARKVTLSDRKFVRCTHIASGSIRSETETDDVQHQSSTSLVSGTF